MKRFFDSLLGSDSALQSLRKEEEEAAHGAAPRKSGLLARSLLFPDLRAEDIATPRSDIVAIPIDLTWDQLIVTLSDKHFSRLPVYEDTLDTVVGMVHIKDVVRYALKPETFHLRSILRPISFIAPSMSVRDLLIQMQTTRQHMAIVVDEFGGVDGLVTMEDIVEEIVGDIHDEHEDPGPVNLVAHPDGTFIVDARLLRREFFERTRVQLRMAPPGPEEESDTIGGFVSTLLGHVPTKGELVILPGGVTLEVLESDPRRLRTVRVSFSGKVEEPSS